MAMSEWRTAFSTWWARRRRFAEEWAFHRDMAVAEFEALGYSPRRAREMAAQRMGVRSRHQPSALVVIGGDVPGLLRLLPFRSLTRSAYFVPATLALTAVLALSINRTPATTLRCIAAILFCMDTPANQRLVPLTPEGVAPVNLAGAVIRGLALVGLGWATANLLRRRFLRAYLYSVIVLSELLFGGALLWVNGVQALATRSWGHDFLQGLALLAFLFSFLAALYAALRAWWNDVGTRCPYCLRLPGMTETRGNLHDVLVYPLESESVCFYGHGLLLQSRWDRRFDPASRGFL